MTNDADTREQARRAEANGPGASEGHPSGNHRGDARDEMRREATAEDFGPVGARSTRADLPDEVGVLRDELERNRDELVRLREEVEGIRREAEEAREKFLRARADLENVRRRTAGDVQRAREAGLDSAVLNVLNVYDDLSRALQMADEADPSQILPGIRTVREALERNLGSLEIERVGEIGEPFDPDLHEALTSVPAPDEESAGTIADVYQAGFKRGERLVRPARVVVYAQQD